MTIIGISALNRRIDDKLNMRLPFSYIDSVRKSGGSPIGIPILNDEDYIDEVLETIDGLLIPGGDDVNPILFNEKTSPLTKGIDDDLDKFQIDIILKALQKDIPILGICRGHQVLNVALSGTLYQDISEMKRDELIVHEQLKLGYNYQQTIHDVYFQKESILYKLYGEKIMTNSFHHQIIKKLGDGLEAIGHSNDGVIEAIQSHDHRFVIGVQWHPERSEDQKPLLKSFIDACRH